ncbi:MAG: ABC transporter substrate-binding protein [Deltaproteobacteria bacterium]|nr:ABC transporter substrate-binding protein [Deltaproteobacteria bacterium]
MLGRTRCLKLGLIVMVLCFGSPSRVMAETPREQLQGTIDRVIEVLQTIRSAEDIEKNKGLLRKILSARFDFTEMARRSLGNRWNDLNEKEGEFVLAFTEFIERAYFGRLGSYQGEKIVYGRERVNRGLAEVNTEVVGGRGDAIGIDYRLHLMNGEWKVYDIVIEHVSVVSNYRSQFRRILQTASLEELLRKLREKGSPDQS